MAEMETFELWVSSKVPLDTGRHRKRRSAEKQEGGRDLQSATEACWNRIESVPCTSWAEPTALKWLLLKQPFARASAENIAGIPP